MEPAEKFAAVKDFRFDREKNISEEKICVQ